MLENEITRKFQWYYEYLEIGTRLGVPVIVYKGELFVAGIPKNDFNNYISKYTPSEQIAFRQLRAEAGKHFTEIGISTNEATNLLINKGTWAYADGCREEWALYSNSSTNKRGCMGCIIPIVIILLLYFLFK